VRLTPLRPPAYIAIKLLVTMLLGFVSVEIGAMVHLLARYPACPGQRQDEPRR
jgi:hypothetical protein